jgi:hypothetical protein
MVKGRDYIGGLSVNGTGESRYTRFLYPCFRVSAVLFQYHEEHQYSIRGHGRSCYAGPLSCARSFTDSPHHFDSRDYKLRSLTVYCSENLRECYTFPVLRVFDTAAILKNATPAYNKSHLYTDIKMYLR